MVMLWDETNIQAEPDRGRKKYGEGQMKTTQTLRHDNKEVPCINHDIKFLATKNSTTIVS